MGQELTQSVPVLMAGIWNALNGSANASAMTMSEVQLIEGIATAFGATVSRFTQSPIQMLAAGLNAITGNAGASALSMSEPQILAAMVNGINGDSAISHLATTVAQLWALLLTAAPNWSGAGGSSPSLDFSKAGNSQYIGELP